MALPTDKEIKHAVRTCHWRQDIGGVPICAGACNICDKEIERGTCDTLRKLRRVRVKITITVADRLFKRDIEVRFQEFFERVAADIADSLENGGTGFCGRYELDTAVFLQHAFARGQYDEEEDENNG